MSNNEMDPHGQADGYRDMFLTDCIRTLDLWENWLKELSGYIETAPTLKDAIDIMADFRNAVHNNVTGFITLSYDHSYDNQLPDLG